MRSEAETGLASLEHAQADAARERFEAPASDAPRTLEQGAPERIPAGGVAPPLADLEADPGCPAASETRVRAWRGDGCAGYEAEIDVWTAWCADRCDENGTDLVAERAAMAACSAWCAERGCDVATFVAPRYGCSAYGCYGDDATCPSERCPVREYCSLLDSRRVWNCFCRDLGGG